jgi:exonuclease VII large subunit
MVGSIVSSEGKVSSKSEHEAGHVFLTISSDGAKIQVPIFSSVASRMSGVQRIKVGSSVSVTGRLDEYRGQLQIVPRKAEDVRLVS